VQQYQTTLMIVSSPLRNRVLVYITCRRLRVWYKTAAQRLMSGGQAGCEVCVDEDEA